MKTAFITRVCLLAGALTAIGLISCSERNESQPPNSASDKWWNSRMQHALAHYNTDDYTLALSGYKYRGKVKTEAEKQQLLDEIFADGTNALTYNGKGLSDPIMATWGEIRKIKGPNPTLRESVESDIVVGQTDVIDLEWTFEGATYNSVAIANDDGKLYDNIGSFAITEVVSIEKRQICETKTETDSFGDYHIPFLKHEHNSIPFQIAKWEISIERNSHFNKKRTAY